MLCKEQYTGIGTTWLSIRLNSHCKDELKLNTLLGDQQVQFLNFSLRNLN